MSENPIVGTDERWTDEQIYKCVGRNHTSRLTTVLLLYSYIMSQFYMYRLYSTGTNL